MFNLFLIVQYNNTSLNELMNNLRTSNKEIFSPAPRIDYFGGSLRPSRSERIP